MNKLVLALLAAFSFTALGAPAYADDKKDEAASANTGTTTPK